MYKTIGVSNWNRDLDAYYQGTGPYWVPDPPIGATVTQLRIAKNNAELKRKSIQDMIDTIPQDPWDLTPMQHLINLLSQKIFTYDSVIAEMTATPAPLPSTEPKPEEEYQPPAETTDNKSTMTLLLIAGGLAGLYFIGKSRNKKKVAGANDEVLMLGIGIGTLILLSKKKTVPAEPTEQTTT